MGSFLALFRTSSLIQDLIINSFLTSLSSRPFNPIMPRMMNKLGIYRPQIITAATHAQNLLFFKFLITISIKTPLAIDSNTVNNAVIFRNVRGISGSISSTIKENEIKNTITAKTTKKYITAIIWRTIIVLLSFGCINVKLTQLFLNLDNKL